MRHGRGVAPVSASRIEALRKAFRSWSIRTKIVLAASVVVAGICVPAAMASTLAGETFTTAWANEIGTLTVSCGPTPLSPFTYHVEGTATGPHSGMFVEDGKVVPGPDGFLVALDATFTITSESGNVTGEKHLDFPEGSFGRCADRPFPEVDLASVSSLSQNLCYSARFGGGAREEGRSSLSFTHFATDDDETRAVFTFFEDFVPDPTVSCQDGGEEKVAVCHRPPGNPGNAHTIHIGASAASHHLGHGDTPGPCLP